jgi:hypothetical protein
LRSVEKQRDGVTVKDYSERQKSSHTGGGWRPHPVLARRKRKGRRRRRKKWHLSGGLGGKPKFQCTGFLIF